MEKKKSAYQRKHTIAEDVIVFGLVIILVLIVSYGKEIRKKWHTFFPEAEKTTESWSQEIDSIEEKKNDKFFDSSLSITIANELSQHPKE